MPKRLWGTNPFWPWNSTNTVHNPDRDSIDAQAQYLLSHPNARILLEGNTDSRGSREYNIALGERRSISIGEALKLDGVGEEQIRLVSYGEEKPVALGTAENSYRLNRRVNLIYEVIG